MTGPRRMWLVARREWDQRTGSAPFRISTVVSIAIVVAIIALPQMYGGIVTPSRTVGLVGETSSQLPTFLRAAGRQFGFAVTSRDFADQASAESALRAGDVDVLLVDQGTLVWKAEPDERLRAIVAAAVQAAERQQTIASLGLTAEEAQRLLQPPPLAARSLEPATGEGSSRIAVAIIGMILLFTAISVYGGFLVVGVVEEKSSRVVEVVLSRLRPVELLSGKVIGIGLVGLAQFAIVGASALVAIAFSHNTKIPSTAPGTIAWILFWFVLGFGFYSVLFAAAGSLVSRSEEAQSVTFPVTAVLLVGYLFAFTAIDSPDSTAAVIASLFPPTAPMVMLVRLGSGSVPWWQIGASIVLMLVATLALVRLAGRIYAGAILRTGRRVRLREAWRGGEG